MSCDGFFRSVVTFTLVASILSAEMDQKIHDEPRSPSECLCKGTAVEVTCVSSWSAFNAQSFPCG